MNAEHVCVTELRVQVVDYGCVKSLLSNTKTLRQILEEAVSLLKMFWRAALPSSDRPTHSLVKVGGRDGTIYDIIANRDNRWP